MNDFRKSLYIFLTALLGVLMFMLLERLAAFFYWYLLAGSYIPTSLSYLQIAMFDYIFLVLAMMFGAWYGVWLGLYWYRKIYEEESHPGLVGHLAAHYFPRPGFAAPKGVAEYIVRIRIPAGVLTAEQLETVAAVHLETIPGPTPIKRKIVRKKAPKKLKTARVSSVE